MQDFFKDFKDPYMEKKDGQGVFLSGLVLGMIAREQANKMGSSLDASPLYKQINFGRMQRRDLSRLMSRVPELTRVYDLPYADKIESLCAEAGKRLMEGLSEELGVSGNFAFSVAFLNAQNYFWEKIFQKQVPDEESEEAGEQASPRENGGQQLTIGY